LRAMLVSEIPFILKKEIYASASLLGASSFLLFDFMNLSIGLTIWGVVLITICIRLVSWRCNYHLPS